jgi:hypothetical protein
MQSTGCSKSPKRVRFRIADEGHVMHVAEVAHLVEGVCVAHEEDGKAGTAEEGTHEPEIWANIYSVKLLTRNAQWSKNRVLLFHSRDFSFPYSQHPLDLFIPAFPGNQSGNQ